MSEHRSITYSRSFLFLLIVSLFMVACGSSSGSSSVAPTPTQKPTPTPTPALTTYQGSGFSIGTPKGWTTKKGSTPDAVLLTDPTQNGMLVQGIPGASSQISMSTILQEFVTQLESQSKNIKPTAVPAKTTINGVEWDQSAATGQDPQTGKSMKFIALAARNPKNSSKAFLLVYSAESSVFDKINTEDFQPMLQSFKFQA